MENGESTVSTEKKRRGLRRTWLPITALALAAVAMILVQTVFAWRLDRGGRISISFIILLIAVATVLGWFLFASGVSRRARAVVGLVLGGGLLFLLVGVRRVEFSGDMVPTFDFRWTTDRNVRLERHRALQRNEYKTGDDSASASPLAIEVAPDDVLEYRGPRRDGVMPGPALARDWSANPPKLVWRQPVGGGYASFVVVGGVLATIEQRRDQEAIVAYDANTGRELWACEYPALFSEQAGGDGPRRATSAFHQGNLYSLGATGELSCVDFSTGKPLWRVNILQQNENRNLDWAMSGSPLVYDGVVLVNPGAQKGTPQSRAVVAYDLDRGQRQWAGGSSKASYASPMLVTLGGVRQLLIFEAAGLAGYDAGDGRPLWRFDWTSDFDINAAQPVVVSDDRVLITSAAGAALVEVAQTDGRWEAKPVWRNRNLKGGYASPMVYDGHVYGLDENMLACLDLETGKRLWKARGGQYGHGQLLGRDDLLIVLGEAGELALVEATPEKFHELGRIQAIEGKTWNVPVLVGRRIFVRNHLEMTAYDLPLAEDAAGAENDAGEVADSASPETAPDAVADESAAGDESAPPETDPQPQP